MHWLGPLWPVKFKHVKSVSAETDMQHVWFWFTCKHISQLLMISNKILCRTFVLFVSYWRHKGSTSSILFPQSLSRCVASFFSSSNANDFEFIVFCSKTLHMYFKEIEPSLVETKRNFRSFGAVESLGSSHHYCVLYEILFQCVLLLMLNKILFYS